MQIPDDVRKSVAFVCYRANKDSDILKLAGTAFYVMLPPDETNFTFGYIVTAKHVIVNIKENSVDGIVYIRSNKKDATSALTTSHVADWRFHPEDPSIDVAAIPGFLSQDIFDVLPIGDDLVASDKVINEHRIGVGDEVFFPGLFSNHVGQERNLPIVRTGSIALMPGEPVQVKDLGPIDAYLIEARSIGGLSGSPVFVYLGSSRIYGNTVRTGKSLRFYWIGLIHGHWDLNVSGEDSQVGDALTNERVNMGIAIVIPVEKILEVINQKELVDLREERTIQRKRDGLNN